MSEQKAVVVIPADYPAMVGRSAHLEQLRQIADVRLHSDLPQTEEEMLERLQPADILLNSRSAVKVGSNLLARLPRLKMIAVCGIGYDSIDLDAASQRGIVVSNIPGRTATVVAEHAFALMLSVARRIPDMTRQVASGHWPDDLGTSLIGKQVGVIGTGNIGRQMIRLCRALGMRVVAWSFHPQPQLAEELGFEYVSLEQVLQTSSVISLHVRLSEQSRHLIGAAQLALMNPGTILINTARAAVVDTDALVKALHQGQLFGAGIDVYDQEPVVPNHPLSNCPNTVLTPHSADQTPEGLDILTLGCCENIRAFLNGEPQNVVSR
ncbi:MAG: NAD(P)-binding domain-containing protein [Planctomycetaceae bacterium]|nr:NAD(P)-binding domain-containing protein [Planctomycetaceae bacterium]